MAKLTDLHAELDFLSGAISTQIRSVAAGVLAFSWAIIIAEPAQAVLPRSTVTPVIILALLSLALDLLQYFVAYIGNNKLRRTLEQSRQDTFSYETESPAYVIRNWCFYLKVLCALCGAGWLIYVLGRTVVLSAGNGGGP